MRENKLLRLSISPNIDACASYLNGENDLIIIIILLRSFTFFLDFRLPGSYFYTLTVLLLPLLQEKVNWHVLNSI